MNGLIRVGGYMKEVFKQKNVEYHVLMENAEVKRVGNPLF